MDMHVFCALSSSSSLSSSNVLSVIWFGNFSFNFHYNTLFSAFNGGIWLPKSDCIFEMGSAISGKFDSKNSKIIIFVAKPNLVRFSFTFWPRSAFFSFYISRSNRASALYASVTPHCSVFKRSPHVDIEKLEELFSFISILVACRVHRKQKKIIGSNKSVFLLFYSLTTIGA